MAAAAEWASLILNGAPDWTVFPHRVCKCLDYIMSPLAGILFIRQLTNQGLFRRTTAIVLGINTVFQILSIFTGWSFYVDEQNYYHHGPLNYIYTAIYLLVIVLVFVEFLRYGKGFKRQNKISMYSIVLVILLPIFLQEVVNSEIRAIYMGLAFGSVLLFIHYSEFSQQAKDDALTAQQHLLETDPLTGLFSRYAYTQKLMEMEQNQNSLQGVTVFSIDINGLKKLNDRKGHLAGDELIRGSSACIAQELSAFGKCYRTGGDEFIAFLTLPEGKAGELKNRLVQVALGWKGQQVDQISLSVGYAVASDYPGEGVEKLIYEADQQMYVEKNKYYQQNHLQRRR